MAWGLLGNGVHHLRTFVDDVMIANVEFEVVVIGNGFVTGLERTQRLRAFPEERSIGHRALERTRPELPDHRI